MYKLKKKYAYINAHVYIQVCIHSHSRNVPLNFYKAIFTARPHLVNRIQILIRGSEGTVLTDEKLPRRNICFAAKEVQMQKFFPYPEHCCWLGFNGYSGTREDSHLCFPHHHETVKIFRGKSGSVGTKVIPPCQQSYSYTGYA